MSKYKTDKQVYDEAEQLVKRMEEPRKDKLYKGLVGEQRYEVLKQSAKYKSLRDQAIVGFLVPSYYSGFFEEETFNEKYLKDIEKYVYGKDLSSRYRNYAIKGLSKFKNITEYILHKLNMSELDSNLMRYQGTSGNTSTYVYAGRFLINYDNSPEKITVYDYVDDVLVESMGIHLFNAMT